MVAPVVGSPDREMAPCAGLGGQNTDQCRLFSIYVRFPPETSPHIRKPRLVSFDPKATFDFDGHACVPTIDFEHNRDHGERSLWRTTSRNGLKDLA